MSECKGLKLVLRPGAVPSIAPVAIPQIGPIPQVEEENRNPIPEIGPIPYIEDEGNYPQMEVDDNVEGEEEAEVSANAQIKELERQL